MKLKLDENLSCRLQPCLQALGHDVCTVLDEGLLGHPDTVIAAAARNEGRVLLTLDSDFGNIQKFPPGTHPGIVLFRPRQPGLIATNAFIENFMRSHALPNVAECLVIVEPTRVRMRRSQRHREKS